MTPSLRTQSGRPPSSLILFDGPWGEHERHRVAQLVAEIERHSPVPDARWLIGPPWVCALHEVRGERYYIATWRRLPSRLVRCWSFQGLLGEMRDLAALPCGLPEPA